MNAVEMMESRRQHAIVFGASGLIGWAVVDQLLRSYPEAGTFSKITAVTNRAVQLSESHWPERDTDRPTLQLISGIDLCRGEGATLANALKEAVEDIHTVTHLFYLGMSQRTEFFEQREVDKNKCSLQSLTRLKKSPRIDVCSKTSSMVTTCSAPTCDSWFFLVEHE
jgi:hypothetical protein